MSNIEISSTDSVIYFAYAQKQASTIFKLDIPTSKLTKLSRPVPGIIKRISLTQNEERILCAYAEIINGSYSNSVASYSIGESHLTKLFEVKAILMDVTQSRNDKELLLLLAGNFGKSSPFVNPRSRAMNIYSYIFDSLQLRPETDLSTYEITGKLKLEDKKDNIYFNVTFLPKQSNSLQNDGPYRYNINSKSLEYLTPKNMDQLQPDIKRNADIKRHFTRFLTPIASIYNTSLYYLHDVHNIYQVNSQTLMGRAIPYRQNPEKQSGILAIRNIVAMHKSNSLVLLINNKSKYFLRILKENGQQEDIEINSSIF
jgi:hypothetical protein